MRKKSIFLLVLVFTIFVWNHVLKVEASSNGYFQLDDYIYETQYQIIRNDLEVYGNQENMSSTSFMNIVENGLDKIYIHYHTDYKTDLPYDLLVIVKKNNQCEYYQYCVNEKDEEYLLEGIKGYLKKNNNEICKHYFGVITRNNSTISTYNDVPKTFIDSVATANFTIDFPKKGYIVSRIAISEYRVNNISSIFIAKVISSFVPGYVAKENGLNYDKWRNNSGYVHITLDQAMDRNEEYYYGIRYGAIPYMKDYWPINQPTTVTIGSTLNTGLVLGYSQKDGFSVDANLISYGYSKSITYDNPHVNVQMSTDLKTAQWSYVYDKNRPWTYDQEANYMYEISGSGKDMIYGDVRLKIDYKFIVDRDGVYSKQENYGSLDLMVRPYESKIWNFCNGMI